MTVVSGDLESIATVQATPPASATAHAMREVPIVVWFTVERLLYALALVAGAFVRFWQLGRTPLQPIEAANAWAAYLAAQGHAVTDAPAPTSALLYGIQWMLFWMGVNGDMGARVAGATAGTLLVLAAWSMRSWLGRGAALALVWLLAFDPWLVALSRLADGAALGLVLGVTTLAGMMRVALSADSGEQAVWRRMTALSAGLLIVSGAMAWNWLPVLLLFAWLNWQPLSRARLFSGRAVMWAAAAVILGATCGLTRLDGVAAIGTSLGEWLGQFWGPSRYGVGWPWIRLAVDEPLAAVLGLIGLAAMTLRKPAEAPAVTRVWIKFLWGWLFWGVFLWAMPGRSPLALPMVGLPLLVGASWALAHLIGTRPRGLDWREAAALAATLTVLLVSGSFWAAAFFFNRAFDPVMAQATGMIFMLAGAILVIYALWASRRHAAWMALLVVAVALGLSTLRSGHLLNHVDSPGHIDGFYVRLTHPEVRMLVQDIETLSAHRTGTPHQLPVLVQVASDKAASGESLAGVPDPVLGWYMRAMLTVDWMPFPAPAETANLTGEASGAALPVAITLRGDTQAEGTDGAAGAGYSLPDGTIGSAYQIEYSWLPNRAAFGLGSRRGDAPATGTADRWSTWVQPLARWLIYRNISTSVSTRDVLLWVPATAD